jgi:hypothetical protein
MPSRPAFGGAFAFEAVVVKVVGEAPHADILCESAATSEPLAAAATRSLTRNLETSMADEKIPMAGTTAPAATAAPGQQQVQIGVDVSNRETAYMNFFQAHMNADEVYLDIGQFSQVVTPSGAEPIVVTHRLVMNFATAKRLAEVMRAAIARHEQMFGVVELDPNRRLRTPPQAPRPPAG